MQFKQEAAQVDCIVVVLVYTMQTNKKNCYR